MPPKAKVTKEQIVDAGLALAREAGPEAINARAVAAKLGCSTQPVFSNYGSMEALQKDVLAAAYGLYQKHLEMAVARGEHPPYKAMGLGYIDFARQEPALFRWLYMRSRAGEPVSEDREENAGVIRLIAEKTGLDEDAAWLFHLEMWIYVHGVATMLATGYVDWDQALVSDMLTDVFEGLKARFQSKERM